MGARIGMVETLAEDLNGALIRRVNAGDDFNQSGFTRPIFTDERMSFAGVDI